MTAPRPGPGATAAELGATRVGVVVPAYREGALIERVLRGIPPWVEAVFVVDDASPDDTAERAEAVGDPRVKVLRHDHNQGVGAAMQTGFEAALQAGLDIVVKMDGDDQMDPRYLPDLLAPLLAGEADVVKGNRYTHLDALAQMPLVRIVGNAGLTFLVKAASGYWQSFDPSNGYLAVRTPVLERLDLSRLPRRFFFESGFLIELGIQRAVVQSVPIPARYGAERSSLSIRHTLVSFPPRLFWGLVRRLFWRYFVHDFSAVSLFLLVGLPSCLFGLVFGSILWWRLHDTAYASAGMVMLAAMPIILGVQMLLQAVVLDIQNVPARPISPPLPRPAARAEEREPAFLSARDSL